MLTLIFLHLTGRKTIMKHREATIYDIAKALKISPATVSRAFSNSTLVNKQTRKKILAVATEMGYRTNQFAKSLREQKQIPLVCWYMN